MSPAGEAASPSASTSGGHRWRLSACKMPRGPGSSSWSTMAVDGEEAAERELLLGTGSGHTEGAKGETAGGTNRDHPERGHSERAGLGYGLPLGRIAEEATAERMAANYAKYEKREHLPLSTAKFDQFELFWTYGIGAFPVEQLSIHGREVWRPKQHADLNGQLSFSSVQSYAAKWPPERRGKWREPGTFVPHEHIEDYVQTLVKAS